MNLEIQTTPFGSFTAVDMVASKVYGPKLIISDRAPTTLRWKMSAPQHTLPLGIRHFVRFWDDAAGQTASAPAFEGFIEEVNPGEDSNEVEYVAMDPTAKASQDFSVMNVPWEAGTVPTVAPAYGTGAYPRLVFNSKIDSDDDFAFERANDLTVGEMIALILDDSYHPLYWANSGPGDGSSAGNGVAYTSADLTALDYKPQEKETFETEPIRTAIERLLRYHPTHRLMWHPGSTITDRRWRFFNLTTADTVTLTLNDYDATNLVLSMNLDRSIKDRYSAVHFFGPETTLTTVATTADGSLTDISDGPLLQNNIGSCCDVRGKNRYQVTDAAKRAFSRLLPEFVTVQTGPYSSMQTNRAVLVAHWPQSQSSGAVGGSLPPEWRVISSGITFNTKLGIIDFHENYLYRYNATPGPGMPHYENPDEVKFIYGLLDNPIQVRYPTSGFEGTSYTVANIQNEKLFYDDMLSVGKGGENNQPVTTATRLAQYAKLAQYLHLLYKDIVYTGGVVLHGLRYDFMRLNKRINIAAVDGDNNSLTTGWESIGAMLTDVEYDFAEMTTTLQFSSDHLELVGNDVDLAKSKLKIRALEYRRWMNVRMGAARVRNRTFSDKMGGFHAIGTVVEQSMIMEGGDGWFDPISGEQG